MPPSLFEVCSHTGSVWKSRTLIVVFHCFFSWQDGNFSFFKDWWLISNTENRRSERTAGSVWRHFSRKQTWKETKLCPEVAQNSVKTALLQPERLSPLRNFTRKNVFVWNRKKQWVDRSITLRSCFGIQLPDTFALSSPRLLEFFKKHIILKIISELFFQVLGTTM